MILKNVWVIYGAVLYYFQNKTPGNVEQWQFGQFCLNLIKFNGLKYDPTVFIIIT